MSEVESPDYQSVLLNLPNPHTSSELRVEDESLAWEMAYAQKPFEDRRIHWQSVINRIEDDPHGVYGRTSRYKQELTPLIMEYRAIFDEDEDKELTEEEWVKNKVRRFNLHAPSVIPNAFVTDIADKLVKQYESQSYVAAEVVHYSDVAPRNIVKLESYLGTNGQEVFAPLRDESDRYVFRYFDRYDVSDEVKKLEIRLGTLADIVQRKDAYLAIAHHFGSVATGETVTREDVVAFGDLLKNHYVGFRFDKERE
jgi:hypothetical protein